MNKEWDNYLTRCVPEPRAPAVSRLGPSSRKRSREPETPHARRHSNEEVNDTTRSRRNQEEMSEHGPRAKRSQEEINETGHRSRRSHDEPVLPRQVTRILEELKEENQGMMKIMTEVNLRQKSILEELKSHDAKIDGISAKMEAMKLKMTDEALKKEAKKDMKRQTLLVLEEKVDYNQQKLMQAIKGMKRMSLNTRKQNNPVKNNVPAICSDDMLQESDLVAAIGSSEGYTMMLQ